MSLVRLDADRQVVNGAGRPAQPLWATWGRQDAPDLHSWPCRPPGAGERSSWAALRVARGGTPARLAIGDAQGAEHESAPFPGVPIYLQWSPSGRRVAVVTQVKDALEAWVITLGDEVPRRWLSGAPLFFAWLDDDALVAHVGREAGRNEVLVVDADGARAFAGSPAGFCVPVPTRAGVVWVAQHGGHTALLETARAGLPSRELEVLEGLAAMVPRDDGAVLRAVSADGDGRSYADLRAVDPAIGRTTRVTDAPLTAFLPVPRGGGTVVARTDARAGAVGFFRVAPDGRDEVLLVRIRPSRDLRFWLRFFEQFAPSHPLVDPEGRWLVVSGTMPGDARDAPQVWRVPLDGGPPELVGEGPFACFAPPARGERP